MHAQGSGWHGRMAPQVLPRSRLSPHPASCAQGSCRHEGDLGQPHLPWWGDKDNKTSATEK